MINNFGLTPIGGEVQPNSTISRSGTFVRVLPATAPLSAAVATANLGATPAVAYRPPPPAIDAPPAQPTTGSGAAAAPTANALISSQNFSTVLIVLGIGIILFAAFKK